MLSQLQLFLASAAGLETTADVPNSSAPAGFNSRAFQLEHWDWDVFISHAGQDKRFGCSLHCRVKHAGLRCFLDDMSLRVGCDASVAMEAAARSTQVAVLLLSEEFFTKEWPKRELRWFLEGHRASRHILFPVFLGVTVEECEELAAPLGLADVCKITGVRHKNQLCRGNQVTLEATLVRIVQMLCHLTGMRYRAMPVE